MERGASGVGLTIVRRGWWLLLLPLLPLFVLVVNGGVGYWFLGRSAAVSQSVALKEEPFSSRKFRSTNFHLEDPCPRVGSLKLLFSLGVLHPSGFATMPSGPLHPSSGRPARGGLDETSQLTALVPEPEKRTPPPASVFLLVCHASRFAVSRFGLLFGGKLGTRSSLALSRPGIDPSCRHEPTPALKLVHSIVDRPLFARSLA